MKNGFVDERSKRIVKEIQALHDAKTQGAEGSTKSPNINMSQLYVDVVGGVKKQRIYGLEASSFINENSYGSYATSQLLQDAMKEMITSLMDELRCNGMQSTSMPPPRNTQVEHSVDSNDGNLGNN
nr:uncharacterized protein LOC109157302 isoform X2 [Ipomoea batatas]